MPDRGDSVSTRVRVPRPGRRTWTTGARAGVWVWCEYRVPCGTRRIGMRAGYFRRSDRFGKTAIGRQRLRRGACFVVGTAHELPLLDASVDVVFGIAILHHLDLPLVSREVHRVLRQGGRAIFQEPVRNSPTLRALRSLIPWTAVDVSPFERPLTDDELRAFAAPFSSMRVRAFCLPHVMVGALFSRGHVHRLYQLDAMLLRTVPSLQYYAGIRVIEVVR